MAQRYLNPFTPIFGKVPPYFAGRDRLISDFSTVLVEEESNPLLFSLFSGPRGTGKTALLHYLTNMARERGWIGINTSAIPGMLTDILQRALSDGEHLIDSESPQLTSLGISSLFSISWENPKPDTPNWRSSMMFVLDQLAEHDAGLLIAVDEAKATAEMVELVSVFQHFIGEGRKVALLMAGLPHDVSQLLSHEDISFLRRASLVKLENASLAEASVALRRTIEDHRRTIDPDALDYAAEASLGYPYLIQLIGFRMWACDPFQKNITLRDAQDGVLLARDEYTRGVLVATYSSLSAGDIRFLEAMLVDEGPSSMKDIAERMGVAANYASKYRSRLTEQGIIGKRGRSAVGVDLPFFKEFVKSQMDG